MAAGTWVLVNRNDEHLYLKLTFSKVGVSKGAGRAVWEWTEDFRHAQVFSNLREIETGLKLHKCPSNAVKVRPYENAHLSWSQKLGKTN